MRFCPRPCYWQTVSRARQVPSEQNLEMFRSILTVPDVQTILEDIPNLPSKGEKQRLRKLCECLAKSCKKQCRFCQAFSLVPHWTHLTLSGEGQRQESSQKDGRWISPWTTNSNHACKHTHLVWNMYTWFKRLRATDGQGPNYVGIHIFSKQQVSLVLRCRTISDKADSEEPICTGWFRNGSPVLSSTNLLLWVFLGILGSRRLGAFKVRDLILVRSCLGACLYRGIQSLFVRERGNVGVRFLLLILHEHHHA